MSNTYVTFTPKKLFHCIELREREFNGEVFESLFWNGMTLEQYQRWKWYFRYRAALLQVKHPKLFVAESWGTYDATPKDQVAMYERRIIARKRKITEWKNKLKKFEAEWDEKNSTELFPQPYSKDPFYDKAVAKIARDEEDLAQLQQHVSGLIKEKNGHT